MLKEKQRVALSLLDDIVRLTLGESIGFMKQAGAKQMQDFILNQEKEVFDSILAGFADSIKTTDKQLAARVAKLTVPGNFTVAKTGKRILKSSAQKDFLKWSEKIWGKDISRKINQKINRTIEKAYRASKQFAASSGNLPNIWTAKDTRALNLLDKGFTGWLSSDYIRVSDPRIKNILKTQFGKAVDTETIARKLEEKLGNTYKDYKSWNQLASYQVNLARNAGQIYTYQQSGITEIQYTAIIDKRTTPFCQDMDGRVVFVEDVTTHTDKLLSFDNPDAIREFKPFAFSEQIGNTKKYRHFAGGHQIKFPKTNDPKLNSKTFDKAGVILPPFHNLCRTTTIISSRIVSDFVSPVAAVPVGVKTPAMAPRPPLLAVPKGKPPSVARAVEMKPEKLFFEQIQTAGEMELPVVKGVMELLKKKAPDKFFHNLNSLNFFNEKNAGLLFKKWTGDKMSKSTGGFYSKLKRGMVVRNDMIPGLVMDTPLTRLRLAEEVAFHELGHHVEYNLLLHPSYVKKGAPILSRWLDYSRAIKPIDRITSYAGINEKEHFAEAFTHYFRGGSSKAILKEREPGAFKIMNELSEAFSKSLAVMLNGLLGEFNFLKRVKLSKEEKELERISIEGVEFLWGEIIQEKKDKIAFEIVTFLYPGNKYFSEAVFWHFLRKGYDKNVAAKMEKKAKKILSNVTIRMLSII